MIGDGASPFAIDFDGDGTLQQADGDYQAINLVRVGDDAFHACQGAALDVHLGADTEKRPRLRSKSGTKDRSNGTDLFIVDRDGGPAGANDRDYSRGGQDGQQAVVYVEAAEQIAGEKGEIEFFYPIGAFHFVVHCFQTPEAAPSERCSFHIPTVTVCGTGCSWNRNRSAGGMLLGSFTAATCPNGDEGAGGYQPGRSATATATCSGLTRPQLRL